MYKNMKFSPLVRTSLSRVMATLAVAVAGVLGIAGPASAALVETPLPSNTYITQGGLEWAWAYPLPSSSGGFDLSYQSAFGWRLPTADELLHAPLATDFMFPGANVPFGGTDPVSGATFQAPNAALTGDAACATPYFSTGYLHCDWQDGLGQTYGPWAGMPGADSFADQLVVRGAVVGVPEPPALPLFVIAFGLLAAGAYRRRHV